MIGFTKQKRVATTKIAPIQCSLFTHKHYIGARYPCWCSPFALWCA
ncbi:MAG TPA: transporter [Atlantibacter hermannii]|nr:transporter [Salmonella enterica subsp. enterica serovar Enteritidis]HAI49458.1 transporter [Enterobacteriaceae bacterium]HAP82240.1 transporter [Enterobacteriaceae bacterium]HCC10714.1 transporter [Atlantibacter hermannii]